MRTSSVLAVIAIGLATSAWAQKVPEGFKAELIYRVPDIEHPSVVTCDDAGNLFVGEDPMDMRGPTTKEFDRVLYLRWDPQTGKATKTVFCENLSAVFGLIWHDGALYVMHAPHYTRFRDTNGDGVADERTELADGFGPPAGVFGFNDHIVTGTRLGMDGRVYVSVGDKGIQKATCADGSTITLEGGGVVRMRLDGTELEIFSSGTRNHLDVAMDSLDNIFTYDNTDDGLGWWTRFTHHIETGYYGYPYDYHPHPDRHLPRISEHGGGSPVGAACYREAAWPARFHDAAFHCEWGKGKIQLFTLTPNGANFDAKIEDFMVREGAEEFRPLDLCFSPDGKYMYVADWNFGGWVKPQQAGRLFRVSYVGGDVKSEPPRAMNSDALAAQLKALAHPAHSERMRSQWELARRGTAAQKPLSQLLSDAKSDPLARVHAVWALNAIADRKPNTQIDPAWLTAVTKDADPRVRAQAIRALGLRREKSAGAVIAQATRDTDPTVRMHAAIALGRIGDPAHLSALYQLMADADQFVRFAGVQALRRLNQWQPAEAALRNSQTRAGTLLALTGVYDEHAVKVLTDAIASLDAPEDQAKAVQALAEVHRKADPYEKGWWGTQPAKGKPRRPKQHEWAGTPLVMSALRTALKPGQPEAVRLAAVQAFTEIRDPEIVPQLAALAGDKQTSEALRQAAVRTITAQGTSTAVQQLVQIADSRDSSPGLTVLALEALGNLKAKPALASVTKRLADHDAGVRSQAIAALAAIQGPDGAKHIANLLTDTNVDVRKAALSALSDLQVAETIPQIVAAANDEAVRFEAQLAAAAVPDRRALALYLAGLTSKNQALRKASHNALVTIRQSIGQDIIDLHKRNELPADVRGGLQAVFSSPVPIAQWQIVGPFPKQEQQPKFDYNAAPNLKQKFQVGDRSLGFRPVTSKDPAGRITPSKFLSPTGDVWAYAYVAVESPEDTETTLVLGSDDQVIVWVNGQKVFEFLGDRGWAAEQGRAKAKLHKGTNHIWLQSGNTGGGWDYSVQISRRDERFAFLYENVPAKLDPSVYAAHALKHAGDSGRGLKIFANEKGVGCVKCHAVGGQGGKIGPDLAGVGAKYPRAELIRSVLEPSNRILGDYHMTIVVTADGKVIQGLIKGETPAGIELVDAEGKTHKIAAADIDEKVKSNLSLMPNGLKDGMTLDEFADIIAYLESLKQPPAGGK